MKRVLGYCLSGLITTGLFVGFVVAFNQTGMPLGRAVLLVVSAFGVAGVLMGLISLAVWLMMDGR